MKPCILPQPTFANRLIGCFLALVMSFLASCQQRPVGPTLVTPTLSSTPVSIDSSAVLKTPAPQETATPIQVVAPTFQPSSTPVVGGLPPMQSVPDNCFLAALSPDNVWVVLDCGGHGPTASLSPGAWVSKIGEAHWFFLSSAGIYATWSPDGTMLVVTSPNEPVWLFQTGQWYSRRMLHEATTWPHGAPLWSADNKTLAITNLEQDIALSLLGIDGAVRPLVYNSEFNPIPKIFVDCEPSWSPDGRQIAYLVRSDLKQEKGLLRRWTQLWTVDIASGKKQLLHDNVGTSPNWSPDGQKIAVLAAGELSVLDLETKTLKPILKTGGAFPVYEWSPDGTRLAVDTDKGLFVVSVATGERKLLASEDTFTIIRWTSDGKHLIVLEYIPSTYEHILKILPVE